MTLKLADAENLPLFVAEQRLIGVSHAEIGAYLLGLWGLPYPIVESVANHHDPMRSPQHTSFGVQEAVYVANCLSRGVEIDTAYLDTFGVVHQLDGWRRTAEKLRAH